MPHAQQSRGPNPKDAELFRAERHWDLRSASADLAWLLGRGYTLPSAIELVGNRYTLTVRQRMAVQRSVCTDEQRARRADRCVTLDGLRDMRLAVDGFNILITLEAALSGAYLFVGREGCVRDVASIHGTYRRVSQTDAAIDLVGHAFQALGVAEVAWYLDQPVSNSGRLRVRLLERATLHDWPWTAELVSNPDRTIVDEREAVAISGDSWVIDHAARWANLVAELLMRAQASSPLQSALVVDLR